jgi:excisionase family DNA binding protein
MNRLLNKAEVAAWLGVSRRTVDRLRACNQLRAVHVRGRVLFNPDDLQAFIRALQHKEPRP